MFFATLKHSTSKNWSNLLSKLKSYDYYFERHLRREGFSFNGNVKIINASLKVPTLNEKFNLYKNPVYIASFKSFQFNTNSASKLNSPKPSTIFVFIHLLKKYFYAKYFFQSHLVKLSVSQSVFKDTQRALKHSRHSGSILTCGDLGNWRTLVVYLST